MFDRPISSAPTLDEVARHAGVSPATASRVLNGSARKVADSYRERVAEAAREPSLSTVHVPLEEVGYQLLRAVADEDWDPDAASFELAVTLRDSTPVRS